MDLGQLEEIIRLSQSNDPRKAEANNVLNHLQTLEERWSIGLKLFFESQNEIARYFGLSLVRHFLSAKVPMAQLHQQGPATIRQQIRDCIMKWTKEAVAYQIASPQYITNNIVSILTQLVKIDYPELWPTAFEELLAIGRQNAFGIDILVRIIVEIEVEIVAYDDRRARDEITHNTIIKDTMRAGSTIGDIVIFLCESVAKQATAAATATAGAASSTIQSPGGFSSSSGMVSSSSSVARSALELGNRCLRCLAELIGWIDVSIATHEYTLSVLYTCLKSGTHPKLRYGACACLCELVKKGMDPFVKLGVIRSINLIPALLSVSSELITPKRRAGSIIAANGLMQSQNSQDGGDDDDDDDENDENEEGDFGALVDALFEELLGCWITFEDNAHREGFNPPESSSSTTSLAVGSEIAALLNQTWPLVLGVFGARLTAVAVTVLTSLNRYIGLLKQQLSNVARTNAGIAMVPGYFVASTNVQPLLGAIYRQLQFAVDFTFDASDEEDAEEIESKKEVRKLFVNCCRVIPEACLELISFVLRSLTQPLSQAPFPDVEAALKLMFSFSECGNKNNKWVSEGNFPLLLAALHETDVAAHPHPQVLLSYYELSVRYCKVTELRFTQNIVAHLTSTRGIRNPNLQLKARAAYFLFKLAESMDGKSAVLLSRVAPFGDILFQSDLGGAAAASALTDSAELNLLESIGLMTSSTYQVTEQLYQQQHLVLAQIADTIVRQVRATLEHPQITRYVDQFGERIAHRLSCLSALAKGHLYKPQTSQQSQQQQQQGAYVVGPREEAMRCFLDSSAVVVEAVAKLPTVAAVRARAVIVCHRLLACVGLPSLQRIGAILPLLIQHSDGADIDAVVQLVAQVMLEFDATSCYPLINHFYADIVTKLLTLVQQFEESNRSGAVGGPGASGQSTTNRAALMSSPIAMRQSSGSSVYSDTPDLGQTPTSSSGAAGQQTEELPQVESDRVAINKHLLVFINHLLNCQLQQVMVSQERNLPLLQQVLGHVLTCLEGARVGAMASIPLRKHAILILTLLTQAWSRPTDLIPQPLVDSYQQLLCDQALPTAGQMLSISIAQQHQSFSSAMRGSPGSVMVEAALSPSSTGGANGGVFMVATTNTTNPSVLSLSDASVLSMFAEVGVWLYQFIHCNQNPPLAVQYLQTRLFPALGWPEEAGRQLLVFLQSPNLQPGPVRETFKKFLRSTIQWA